MILTFDTETQGLGGQYLTGSICNEKLKTNSYKTKEMLWNKIIELAEKEAKRGHHTFAYAHNIQYDFYTIWNKQLEEIKFKSTHPIIIEYYNQEKKHIITFLGTEALFPRMTLKEIGKKINTPKTEPPTTLWEKMKKDNKQEYSFEEINQMNYYCENDSLVAMKAIQYIKQKLSQENIKPKQIITIAQLALNIYNKKIRNNPEIKNKLCYKTNNGNFSLNYIKPKEFNFTIKAAREKRFESFQTGYFENCTEVDINSLYPYAATKINFPNLSSELITKQPSQNTINKIGLSECIIKKKKEHIGSIPVRWQKQTCYPTQACTIIGTWTHNELKWYESLGHKIKHIKKSSTYDTLEQNPLKEYMEYFYEKRKNNPNDNLFYKSMMNNLIGKLAQRKQYNSYETINNSKVDEYMLRGYKPMIPGGTTTTIMQAKESEQLCNHYQGIIPYTVWSEARKILYETGLSKIPSEDLLYCNTDSVIFKENHLKKFKLSNEMGDYKISKYQEKPLQNVPCLIYGKGDISIGEQIRLGGITKRTLTNESFITGKVTTTKQIGIKSTKNLEDVGKFTTKNVDLNERRQQNIQYQEDINNTELFIDDYESFENIEYYQKNGLLE